MTVTTTAPPATPPSAAKTDPLVAALLSGALLAAIVGAAANTYLARRRNREDERARVRSICAEALEAVAAYKEFPYAIRRRRADQPGSERNRLADEMRHVQTRLTYYSTWMKGESPALATAYDTLLSNLRRVAGRACHDAWLATPTSADKQMNFQPGVIDLTELRQYEDAYVAAVKQHLNRILKVKAHT
ncbi:hypothetical protein HPO96_34980 [Kribbella sandramycini]|uniref:ABC-type transport system involved in cytochrome bd biosynthesis fused ATPase/permease subunit n=1 Tax=Kribbella sandramycini TaxID=60450 RepID=A0A7Y4P2K5_9ACTN|nr:hypothetical protein [Kribbella sandramycini]MBB6566676.1 ABC-type transport system involved in cytochrome bd biosynthesis fused ATPase/permease subunit [Kribbella sandramycini]NOL45467.1 hypothetical protein [Kribbella sandramycini]